MATLPAAIFTDHKPDGADSGPSVVGDTQENLEALRNAVIAGGFDGWAATREYGLTYTDEVGGETFSKGTERLIVSYLWELSSGTRRVERIGYLYSSDNGVTFDPIGTWVPTYAGAADHRITSETWI